MAGYARQSSSSIADGETITAAPLNSEFDALLAAFAFSGGHNHDGTSTEGAYVGLIADVDALNKIVVDTSNNRHGFFVEVSSSAVEQIRIQDGAIVPVTDSDIDLGTSSLEFKDLYIDGTAYIDTLEVHVGATLSAGVLTLPDGSASAPVITNASDTNQGLYFSGTDEMSFTAGGTAQVTFADGAIKPVTDNDIDLGTSSLEFKNLYIDGTANIDTLAATTMSGDLAMGSNKVTGLAAPTADGDAARKVYVDDSIASAEGLTQLAGIINVNGYHFTGSSGENITFKPVGSASTVSTQDTDGEFVALVLRNESDAASTAGIASLRFDLEDTGGNTVDAAKIAVKKEQSFTATASTQDAKIVFSTSLNGTLTEYLELNSAGALVPVTDNTVDIGTSSAEIKNIYVDGTAYIDAIGFGTTSVTLPTSDGSANQILKTDGSGTISWASDTGTTINNATENELVTVASTTTQLDGEANLTFDGSTLTLNGALAMASNTAGKLLIADGTDFEPTAVGDLAEITSIASDDVLLAVDTSGGGLKRVARSTLVSGLATSSAISNVVEDTTPQLGGDLDVNSNALVSTSNGNIALSPNGTGVVRIDGNVDIQTGEIVLKNGGSVSNIKFYCESSNAHYTQLQSAAHSDYSGNVTLTLPAATDTLVGKATTDTLTNKTLTTPVIAEIDSGGDLTLDATTDVILDAGGGDVFFKDDGTTFGSATNTSGNLIIKSGTTTALTFSGANATAAGNLAVTGDLTVNGTTTTVNSTTVTIDDPIFTLGGDTAPGSDDNKDRGIEFRYHTGSAAKVGFFGYDDSASAFTFIADATNSSEVFSGTAGNVAFGDIAGTLTTAAQTNITSVGALDGGSITSGFGTIDTGSSNITTTGLISGGSLDIDDVLINGTTIGHTDDTDLMTLASGALTVAGTIEGTTITASTAVVPDASGGADLGSTSLEWGDLYIADDKKIYLGSDQNLSIEYDEDGNDTTAVVAAGGVSMAPHGTSAGNGTELRFQELAANGANYVGFKAPDAIGSNEVWVLPNADGSADQVLKTDGSNTLSWADAGGGGTVDLVADGAIAIRKPVVRTAAGKAKQIAESIGSDISVAFTTMDDSDTVSSDGEAHIVYDSTSETFVAVYENAAGSDYPHAVAGTWSEGTITWGTPVVLESNACNREIGIAVGNGKVWAAWARNSANIMITSLSISGTAITVATPTDTSITWSNELGIKLSYDISSNYLLLFNSNQSTGAWLFKVKPYYTTSGGSLTAGATSTIATNGSIHHNEFDVVYDPDTSRTVVAYRDDSNSNYGTANVIQSSGTTGSPTVTIGSDVVFSGTDAVDGLTATYDTANDKVFVGYHNTTDGITKGIIGTVTGGGTNSISFAGEGTINDYTAVSSSYLDVVYDSDASKIIAVYRDDDHTSDGLTYRVITSGASSFSVSSAAVISTNDNQLQSGAAAFGAGKGTVVATRDTDNSQKLSISTLYYPLETPLTKDNYLGVSAAAISDGATGKIVIPGGISEGHSSLTVGSKIFTNGAGAIGLAGNARGLQFLGTAVSATQIQLQEEESDFYAEADGAITAGDPIEINTTSGKIKPIVGSVISATKTNSFYTGDVEYGATMYDPDTDRYVAFYSDSDNSGYGKGVVGQYSSGTGAITWGTPVAFTSTYINGAFNIDATYDEGVDRGLVVYNTSSDGSYKGWARVVTITGGTSNTVAFGTAATYHSSQVRQQTVVYDSDQARCLIVFFTEASPEKCGGIVAQITGGTTNTVAYGSEEFLNSSNNVELASAHFNPKVNKTLAFYKDPGDSSKMKIQQGTITAGTNALSWSSEENADYGNTSISTTLVSAYIPSLEASAVIHYRGSALYGHLVRPQFSTNPWYGSASLSVNATLFHKAIATSDVGTTIDENLVILVRDGNDSNKLKFLPLDITGSGTQITAGTMTQVESGRDNTASDVNDILFDPDASKYVINTKDSTDDNHGLTYTMTGSVDSTKNNFDGFASFTASSGNAVGVALEAGIDDNQSGLTIGSTYYLDSNTALTTTSTSNKQVGRAISATAIQVVTTT